MLTLFSISISPNGWTDMDLGLKWLMYDFHPASNERNPEKEWRMLILDGHNSHCSYAFVDFCEKHQIVLLCLPSHTTHRLQPCDVGVFGPLASCWKSEVNDASRKNIAITKYNLLEIYSRARDRAFTQTTIQSAFRKTGIHPFDPSMIEETAFSPALNTTTQTAQPIPTTLPALLTEIDTENAPSLSVASTQITGISTSSTDTVQVETDDDTGPISSPPRHPRAAYTLLNFPSPLPANASMKAYLEQNHRLREFAEKAKAQMEADYASKKLMDAENGRLRAELFGKKKPAKKREGGSGARHMTGPDMMEALAKSKWEDIIAEFHQLAAPRFKQIRADIAAQGRIETEQKKKNVREAEAAGKRAIREEQKQNKAALAFIIKQITQAQRNAKRELTMIQKAEAAAAKKAAAEAKHLAAKRRREEKERERAAAKEQRELLAKQKTSRKRGRKPADNEETFDIEEPSQLTIDTDSVASLPIISDPQPQPRPRPRPRPRPNPAAENRSVDVQKENDITSQHLNGRIGASQAAQEPFNGPQGIESGEINNGGEQKDGKRRSRRLAVKTK